MTFFEHIHPEMLKTVQWVIHTTLPKPGAYQALPISFDRGTPQIVEKAFVTAGYTAVLPDS